MTTCDFDRLHDYADDALDAESRAGVAAHVRDCARCREELARLERLRSHVAMLPAAVAPPRDLWPSVRAEVERSKVRPLHAAPGRASRRVPRWAGLVAAAALLVVISSAVTMIVTGEGGRAGDIPRRPDAQLVSARAFAGVEAEYLRAAGDLAAALDRQRDRLDSATVARVETSLRTIDQAIAEARAALERDPSNADIVNMLDGTYRQKLDLLRRAAELPARL